jgi:biopolymer transport protein ExbB
MQAIIQFLVAGGVVMIPLLGCSVLAIALIVERLVFWSRINRRQGRLVRAVLSMYKSGDTLSAINQLQENVRFPMARIFLAALELEEPNPEEFRLALESEAQAELPSLKRFNTLLETIITVSPLLGLLGTVTGLMTSFSSLSLGNIGGSQATQVTGGISEALITTATGLVIAVTTLVFANAFRGMYQRQMGFIQEYGGQLELLYRRRYERQEIAHAITR